MIQLLSQPTNHSCGQTCVAMLTGKGFWECSHVIGHFKRTTTKEIVEALRHFGKTVEDHLTVLRGKELPKKGTYLVKLRYTGWQSHWVVLHDGDIYDPAHGMNPKMHEGWRYTSYLKVR